ncbi:MULTISPECIES: hypothetical protein [unclassified Streptomyces]|uniref:hypothetical protein n=1 Tax=unclassified Streptomyces TaxID=2593676 RepID=UPI0036EAFA67
MALWIRHRHRCGSPPPSPRPAPGAPRAASRSAPRSTAPTASLHAETAAFRAAGWAAATTGASRTATRSYRGTTMVTTLSPCWYCSGLVRQFGISRVVIGEATTFHGSHDWLAEHGVEIVLLDDAACVEMMREFTEAHPALWNEDIGA